MSTALSAPRQLGVEPFRDAAELRAEAAGLEAEAAAEQARSEQEG